MSWLIGKALEAASTLSTGFVPQMISFGNLQVVTTALLAEGGYSYVYSAREMVAAGKVFAVKKVLAQDAETRAIAEMESRVLRDFNGTPGFVSCYGTTERAGPNGSTEFWMLLEYCPNGSLIDLVYRKDATGAYERGPALSQERVLEVFEAVVGAVAKMHALSPPVAHRDLKLENILCTDDGRFVLCDFGSATTHVLLAGRSKREAAEEDERIAKYSTQMYRAPEMIDLHLGHVVDERVDVWALGCILYALCFGAHPFPAESSLQILNMAYCIPAGSPYSENVHDLVRAMLSSPPSERPPAAEMLKRIRDMRARRHTTMPSSSPPNRRVSAISSSSSTPSSSTPTARDSASAAASSGPAGCRSEARSTAKRKPHSATSPPHSATSPGSCGTAKLRPRDLTDRGDGASSRAAGLEPTNDLSQPAPFEASFGAAFEATFDAMPPANAIMAGSLRASRSVPSLPKGFDAQRWQHAVAEITRRAQRLDAIERRLFRQPMRMGSAA